MVFRKPQRIRVGVDLPSGKIEFSLSIPFYNEEENAAQCISDHLDALSETGINFEIIAVDNASTDATGRILDKSKSNRVRVIHIKKNIGYGNGIMQGWKIAKGNCIGFTCGDNEIAAESVVKIFKKIQKEGLDLCKGKRVFRDYSFFRKLESNAYNNIFCVLLLGYRHGDINGYPKIMKKSLFEKLEIESVGPFFDTEIMVKAVELGAKLGSVPVEYKKRTRGKSSVPFYIALIFLLGFLRFELKRIGKIFKER